MALSPNEELELLQLEEEEYQDSLKAAPKAQPVVAAAPEQSFPVEQSVPEISQTQSALTGGIQGATMGFSDELGGAKDVVGDILTGNVPNDLMSKYREYQKLREQANKRDQEANPWSYAGGELAGGIGSAVLTPGLGTAKVVAGASKLSPKLAQFLAGQMGGTSGKIAGKGSAMAIEGAPIGALYGAGSSEKTIEGDPAGLATDAAWGAGMGSLGGLAIGAGVEGGKAVLKGAGKYAQNNDTLRQMGEAYKFGEKGLNLGRSDVESKLTLLPGQKSSQLTRNLLQARDDVGEAVGNSIKEAQGKVAINIDPELDKVSKEVFQTFFVDNPNLTQNLDSKTKNLLIKLGKSELGELTPMEAQDLKLKLRQQLESLAGVNDQSAYFAKGKAIELIKALDNSMKSKIPGYADASAKYAKISEVPEMIISKGVPEEYNNIYFGKLKDGEKKLFQANKDMLSGAMLSGEDVSNERATFELLRKKLNELQKTNPEAVQTLGGDATSVYDKLRSQADQIAMKRLSYGSDPKQVPNIMQDPVGNISKILTGSKAPTIGLANKAGLAVGGITKGKNKLVNASKDQLANLSNYLIGNKATEAVGKKLADALSRNDDAGKNAALFVLMQNPGYRDMLRQQGFEVGEGNE